MRLPLPRPPPPIAQPPRPCRQPPPRCLRRRASWMPFPRRCRTSSRRIRTPTPNSIPSPSPQTYPNRRRSPFQRWVSPPLHISHYVDLSLRHTKEYCIRFKVVLHVHRSFRKLTFWYYFEISSLLLDASRSRTSFCLALVINTYYTHLYKPIYYSEPSYLA